MTCSSIRGTSLVAIVLFFGLAICAFLGYLVIILVALTTFLYEIVNSGYGG